MNHNNLRLCKKAGHYILAYFLINYVIRINIYIY